MRFYFLLLLFCSTNINAQDISLLHVSFDVTRELFKDINSSFVKGEHLKIKQSHGGSGKQTAAVIHGLPANIVSLALPYHMDLLAQKNLVAKDWRDLLPNNSSPFSTHIVFLVHKNNPKEIKDWSDLIKPNIKVVTANPKTSGGALWNYVSAWIYASKHYENPQKYIEKLYENAPVLDSTARGSAITFLKRNIGDVLITWNSEAQYIINKLDSDYEIIEPSLTVKINIPVAAILHKPNQEMTQKYLNFLFSKKGQKIASQYYYQTYDYLNINNKNMVNAEDYIDWKIFKTQHFGENGIFEQIYK